MDGGRRRPSCRNETNVTRPIITVPPNGTHPPTCNQTTAPQPIMSVVIDYSFITAKLLIWPTPVDIAVEQDRLEMWQVRPARCDVIA